MLETLRPYPTFHPSARLAMEAEAEHIAYTVLLSPNQSRPDALATVDVDVDPASATLLRAAFPVPRLAQFGLGMGFESGHRRRGRGRHGAVSATQVSLATTFG